jgi:hypothetical protein
MDFENSVRKVFSKLPCYDAKGILITQTEKTQARTAAVFGARHSLVVAAAPLGAAFGGVLLQYLSAPLVIAISGLACIVAGLGGLHLTVTASVATRKPL